MRRSYCLGVFGPAALAVVIGASRIGRARLAQGEDPGEQQRYRVMTSRFCAGCHPAIYAEHEENTHGRAFTDEEVRLATGRFGHGDCIRCHTPRPIFETGIGMNPLRRHHNLEEGNTCMSCHFKPDFDYSRFRGGEECKRAFDPRVGAVEACASCHRNHGTPYQWELAPTGKAAKKTCITCHMRKVRRPVAVGQPPRLVRSHVFPGVRSEEHVRRAYSHTAELDGNEAVVRIKNKGCGHNFPTELKQRSVESLIVVRDLEGREVARSRMVFRDPYKRPYGLTLPVNTQIPAGQTREHRVPLRLAAGTVDCELHFKLYFPIEDHHPDLSRMLEKKRLVFDGITPSEKPVKSAPPVKVVTPEGIDPRDASSANLVDFARPPIGQVELEIPEGSDAAAIRRLIQFFQFPVPEANRVAQQRLAKIGLPAVPALIEALGSWDNKTFKQAMAVLKKIGVPARPALVEALDSVQLYVRVHARRVIGEMGWSDPDAAMLRKLRNGLASRHVVDRTSAARVLGQLGVKDAIPDLRNLLDDPAPDVVRAGALALAALSDVSAAPRIEQAMREAFFVETRRDLAAALASLGSIAGIPVLLEGLDHPDDLIRESHSEVLFEATALHLGFDPLAPRPSRLRAISRLQAHWAKAGGRDQLRPSPHPGSRTHDYAWEWVQKLADHQDREAFEELLALGEDAVSALVLGLKYPPGFAARRARICEALGRIGSRNGAPFLAATLRDPVISVAAWAAWALETSKDKEVLPALRRYQARLLTLAKAGRLPASAGPLDRLLGQAARTRLMLGDEGARQDLVNLLLSPDLSARKIAIDALETKYGERLDYDPQAPAGERRKAMRQWLDR